MTNEEARNILLTSVHPQTAEEAEAIGIAVKAVERMIPKKPAKEKNAPMQTAYGVRTKQIDLCCPQCGAEIGLMSVRFFFSTNRTFQDVSIFNEVNNDICDNCGQAIDWSDK